MITYAGKKNSKTQSHSQLKFCMAPFKTEDHNITIKQQPLLFPG